MYLHIQEPKQKPRVAQAIALGIDLGTTHSLVSYQDDEKVETVELEGSPLVPSVVHYQEDFVSVGQRAVTQGLEHPLNTIHSAKRAMGKALVDINPQFFANALVDKGQQVAFATEFGAITPVEVSSEILKHLYQAAQSHSQKPIAGAVITVPAYFDEAQRLATQHAAQLAGIKVLRLIHEPTAAAIAYGLDQKTDGLCLVFDCGGGTFDVTLLRIQQGVFRVLATGGDSALGGDDMDQAIVSWLLQTPTDCHLTLSRAKSLARKLKETLSTQIEVTFEWQGQTRTLTRDKFNDLITPLLRRLMRGMEGVLADAQVASSDLNDLILVGGATRVPLIQEKLTEYFGRAPLCALDPDQVVAQGAALHAASLIGHKSVPKSLLLDVLPLSLGLETMGGVVEKIMMRNTSIPAQAKQIFTTYENNQTGMILHVVQGEREMARDNRSLAQFTLKNLPLLPKGHAKVEVVFEVDEQGILKVTAQEMTTHTETTIEVKPSYGLSDEDITSMLSQALEHADEDVRIRQLNTVKVEAQQLVRAIEHALREDKAMLSKHELEPIEEALAALAQACEQTDGEAIKQQMKSVERLTDEFMRERLNKTLKSMVSGRSLNALDDVLCRK